MLIRILPVKWQAKWWSWRCRTKIQAIRNIRRTAGLTLKASKEQIDSVWRDSPKQRCPYCGK